MFIALDLILLFDFFSREILSLFCLLENVVQISQSRRYFAIFCLVVSLGYTLGFLFFLRVIIILRLFWFVFTTYSNFAPLLPSGRRNEKPKDDRR